MLVNLSHSPLQDRSISESFGSRMGASVDIHWHWRQVHVPNQNDANLDATFGIQVAANPDGLPDWNLKQKSVAEIRVPD